MDVLCLMGLFPQEYREQIQQDSVTGIQYAADKLQSAIVRGLSQNENVNVSLANSLYIGSYPRRYRRVQIPTFEFEFDGIIPAKNIGFCNITGVKWFSRYYSIKAFVKEWASQPSQSQKVLLVYALATPFVQIAGYVKKHFKDIKVCIIVPDLPEYMNTAAMESNRLYRIAKSIEIFMLRKSIQQVNGYVLLTEAMKEWFGKPIRYTVVEGIASDCQCEEPPQERNKTILYAGGVKQEYGIVDLVNAFIQLKDDSWTLEIYGDGSAMSMIQEMAKKHPNIKLMGMVPNETVIAAQKQASILVNPRKNQEFTKYSFPSKILEYMSSGTPVLAYKLDGMPNEYDESYYHISDTENGMIEALRMVTTRTKEELGQMGVKAQHFVRENKTPEKQCKKIVELLQQI